MFQKDRCTDANKAADEKRNESTWKGCDDTGILGCCCRHNAAIYMANISKSGEQRCFPLTLINRILTEVEPDQQVGILYDIGCSLDKYMKIVRLHFSCMVLQNNNLCLFLALFCIFQRNLFEEHRPCIQMGTLIFHSYVHEWSCQIDYNPCYNTGWGLLDGEGLERMWSYLSPLISFLRYATRNHRLASLSHRLKHHNRRGLRNLCTYLFVIW
ncbi:hypothetical protein PTTG_08658 [Puccinia triticina 1-1 BBBD Race 1]|uniref:CxC1-like cysteine cluster associated with KDZ transposases domain-containing protein n=1 Tax=Puccinia triticina (isolate 1-1 / race 1 (BBBD)) TaxID=630390 RepID=A0A0C4DF85_PUCT1|nr:hypothetical protein PTTG_08658 [Puccinia triticina 1-1 BBBD Race 1]